MVYVHLANGFEEIEAITVVDVLRRANIETKTVSITEHKEVEGAHGIAVVSDILYKEAKYGECSMIVLPGGMPGTINLGAHEGLLSHIKFFIENKKWVAAICAAPMILGQNQLLVGKKATIYEGMENYLIGANPSMDAVVVDGNIITSRGPGTAATFALELVRILKNNEAADRVKSGMLIYD